MVSSKSDASRLSLLAIDGNPSSCSLLTKSDPVTWMRVDIQSVRYIRDVLLQFHGSETAADKTVFVGRSLRGNGSMNNTQYSRVFLSRNGAVWNNFTSPQPVLGQFIYIQTSKSSMQVCEIKVFYGKVTDRVSFLDAHGFVSIDHILNIYSPVKVSASDQSDAASPIWTPIDGLEDNQPWISVRASKSWWRLEFPTMNTVSRVVINTTELKFSQQQRMNGFAVYIGNTTDGNGSKNAMCGHTWEAREDKTKYKNEPSWPWISITCSGNPVGKYLYVAAADSRNAVLYLSEISVYGCKGCCSQLTNLHIVRAYNCRLLRCCRTGCRD